jgi:UDP-N-acetylmuramyl pentapeptide phosphotransferase/UDP-N-acetylglucosamine-1-phosphate transferase
MINIVLILASSFIMSVFAMPSIITMAKLLGLFDKPNSRKLHTAKIPRLGGIGIFVSFLLSVWFVIPDQSLPNARFLYSALLLLFFSGLKDDIVVMSPINKLLIQLFAASLITIGQGITIDHFHGILGINEITYPVSIALSIFTIIVITNSINLIDGVDGLAGGIGFIIALAFAIWFNHIGQSGFALMAFALSGALLGFLLFNFNPAKIFMGDAGSLTVGFLLSVFAIKFISINSPISNFENKILSAPAIAISILIVPLYDTLRVFIIRTIKRKSPFEADRNHVHHVLLKIGLNHKMVCYTLYAISILFTTIAILIKDNPSYLVLSIILGMALVVGQLPVYLYRHRLADLEVEENIINFESDINPAQNLKK